MQCTNYLKAAGLALWLVLNFGALKSHVWSEAYEQHETICMFRVYLLSSALKFLCLACGAAVRAGRRDYPEILAHLGHDRSIFSWLELRRRNTVAASPWIDSYRKVAE
jgi:hypothetical protein